MLACQNPVESMLPSSVVHIKTDILDCDLECARKIAFAEARKYGSDPQLLSWFDRKGQNFSTKGEDCVEGEPSWVAYAKSQGADLTIDLNDEDYVFIFHQSQRMK